jgi:hypothetical protein
MKKIFITLVLLLTIFSAFAQESVTTATTDGTLTVTATVTYSNPYYYAVWIKSPSGTFLRTLTMYGQTSKYYSDLTHWYSESAASKTNATTGATKSSSGTYSSTWNGKDQANSAIVTDGTYTVSIEMTSENYGTSSKYITTTIDKGTSSVTITPTVVSPISNVTIKWIPATTAVNMVESDKYSVYPNPTRSTIYVSGFDIKGIDILTLNGKFIFTTNNQNIDLSTLPKGMYVVRLTTDAGIFFKKIEKI